MSVFLDASALTAIMTNEPERAMLQDALEAESVRLTSGLALWETARAIGRRVDPQIGLAEAERFCSGLAIKVVPIGRHEAEEAILAHARYGKGTGHPARLNMGDCFAYACAKTNGARLLYKGDDFSHTDLA